MATRKTRNSSAIADSVDTAPAVDTVDADTAPTAPAVDPDTADESAPVLSYVVDGVTHTVDPDRLEDLASSVGAGRAARHNRALTVGRFIADYPGMNPNRAHGILSRAGHYVHRDTVYGAAHAYALSAEFVGADILAESGSILADTLSLVDCVGIRKIRGTHNNVSVIDYDALSALTDVAARQSEFESAIHAALSAARNVDSIPDPADGAGSENSDGAPDGADGSENSDGADGPDAIGPDDIPDMWARALTDVAAHILTAGALSAAQRQALEDAARAVLTALDYTADRTADTADTAAPVTV